MTDIHLQPVFEIRPDRPDETRICLNCLGPREIDAARSTPGETHYQPCSACGAIGIRRQQDDYQQIHRKKTFKELYERRRS